jgi:hypothetical protein
VTVPLWRCLNWSKIGARLCDFCRFVCADFFVLIYKDLWIRHGRFRKKISREKICVFIFELSKMNNPAQVSIFGYIVRLLRQGGYRKKRGMVFSASGKISEKYGVS